MKTKIVLGWATLQARKPNGEWVQLNLAEAKVLNILLLASAPVTMVGLSREGISFSAAPNAAAVYVMRLRRKLGRRVILTVPNRGYRLGV